MAENQTFDSNRRLLLSGFGALGVLSLSGCCRLAIQEIKEGHKYNGLTPFSPSLIQKSVLSSKLTIDAHTHFFNAADVPVKEFMQGPVAHALPSKITKDLIYLIAPTVGILSKFFSLSPAREINMLDEIVNKQRKMSASDFQIQFDHDIEAHEREIAKALAIALKNTPFEKEYLEASKKIGLNKVDNTLTENSIYEAMKFGTQSYGLTVSKQADIQNADNPDGVFAFVKCMLSPRHHNLQNYIKAYATDSNAFGVDACLGALVDFNYWLSCPSNSSSIRDQVLLHERLAVLSGGYLLPLVPYNPWTDIKNNRSSLKDVVWAIKEHGFVGVKIYPPMGFYPSGNEDIPAHPNKWLKSDLRKLDSALKELYRNCIELNVPVMAHTGESNGVDGSYDVLAGPNGWKAILKDPEFKNLRINAGHFGGDSTWKKEKNEWTNEFVELMNDTPNQNLYADLGYWNDLRVSDKPVKEYATKRLQSVIDKPLKGGGKVNDRIMYGSDWFMISKEQNWPDYPSDIAKTIFSFNEPKETIDKIYFKNVANLYGLTKTDLSINGNRARLESFYKRWGIEKPAWMIKLDLIVE